MSKRHRRSESRTCPSCGRGMVAETEGREVVAKCRPCNKVVVLSSPAFRRKGRK